MKRKKFYQIKDAFPFLKHPEKYIGQLPITLRSSLEIRFVFKFLDPRPDVISWSSESTIIPYLDESSGKNRRYFVDFYMKLQDKNGETKEYLVEIKPYKETVEPKRGRNFRARVSTYKTNMSKWRAAKKYAEDRNMEFIIVTEREIP